MFKNSITAKAFHLYASRNPHYFPTQFLEILFRVLAPYFSLWMSAEIVTALYDGREAEAIYRLVVITLAGNLLLHLLKEIFRRNAATHLEILRNHETAAFNAKTLSLDYEKMENPEVRQIRRKIRENSCIDNNGVERMRQGVNHLVECVLNIGVAMVFFAEMVSKILPCGFQPAGVLLFAALITLTVLSSRVQAGVMEKMSAKGRKITEIMLEENRLDGGYQVDGMDNRIYQQQKYIDAVNQKVSAMHLKYFVEYMDTRTRLYKRTLAIYQLSELCMYMIICFYCTLGAFPVGSVIKYVGYLGKLIANVEGLFLFRNDCRANEPFLSVYLDYFAIPNEMSQGGRNLSVDPSADEGLAISFHDVSFQYTGTSEDALKDISIDLHAGEKLAVVGRNGSGKTTFIKLLCRLYDPTEGEIEMNGVNIREYQYREYLNLFSVVFQDYQLLAMPLGNNVAGADSWDSEKAERLLNEIGFGERYEKMPQKLNTALYKDFDEDGVNVSGGEAQKIALARALYRDAPFIILDEPTAALDPLAESEIYAKFDEIVGDRTAIYISHRLSSCRFCDRIAVFKDGRIVQLGTHEELLADTTGEYYELWSAQAQYYSASSGD